MPKIRLQWKHRIDAEVIADSVNAVTGDRLTTFRVTYPRHLSPFEHVAQVLPTSERVGNFVGFKQFRKEFEDESGGDYLQ